MGVKLRQFMMVSAGRHEVYWIPRDLLFVVVERRDHAHLAHVGHAPATS